MTSANITEQKRLGAISIILMMFSVIFGITNSPIGFYRMGYASIPCYIFGAFTFFLPLMFMSAEFAVSFKNDGGGIYTWMCKSKGEFYGFVGSFMWYFSIIMWMTNASAKILKSTSSLLFAEDKTKSFSYRQFSKF